MIVNIDEFTIPVPVSIHEEKIDMGVKKGVKEIKVRLQQDTGGTQKPHGFNAKIHFINQTSKDSVEIAFNKDDLTFNAETQKDLNTDQKAKDIYKFYLNNADYIKGAIYYARDLIIDRYVHSNYRVDPKTISNKMKEYSKLPREEQEKYQDECNGI